MVTNKAISDIMMLKHAAKGQTRQKEKIEWISKAPLHLTSASSQAQPVQRNNGPRAEVQARE